MAVFKKRTKSNIIKETNPPTCCPTLRQARLTIRSKPMAGANCRPLGLTMDTASPWAAKKRSERKVEAQQRVASPFLDETEAAVQEEMRRVNENVASAFARQLKHRIDA